MDFWEIGGTSTTLDSTYELEDDDEESSISGAQELLDDDLFSKGPILLPHELAARLNLDTTEDFETLLGKLDTFNSERRGDYYNQPIAILRTFAESYCSNTGRAEESDDESGATVRVKEILNRCAYLSSKNGQDLATLRRTVKTELDVEKAYDRGVRMQERIELMRAAKNQASFSMNFGQGHHHLFQSGYCPIHNCVHYSSLPYNYHRVAEWPTVRMPDIQMYDYESLGAGLTDEELIAGCGRDHIATATKNTAHAHGAPASVVTSTPTNTPTLSASTSTTRTGLQKEATVMASGNQIRTSKPPSTAVFQDSIATNSDEDETEMNAYYRRAINLQMQGEKYNPNASSPTLPN